LKKNYSFGGTLDLFIESCNFVFLIESCKIVKKSYKVNFMEIKLFMPIKKEWSFDLKTC
jgi:hypothetical protein